MLPRFLHDPIDRTWLLLTLATLASFSARADRIDGQLIGGAIVAIAFGKGRLVMLDYMELRHAPLPWRLAAEAWLLLVAAAVLLFYLRG